jgi:hypothetical protein
MPSVLLRDSQKSTPLSRQYTCDNL